MAKKNSEEPKKIKSAPENSQKSSKDSSGKEKKSRSSDRNFKVRLSQPEELRISPSSSPRLLTQYKENVVPSFITKGLVKNIMEVPRLEKIVINCAVKDAVAQPKILDGVLEEIMMITGQKPVITRAKKAIATFKIRSGNALGVMVTLRRARMYEFFDRLIHVALPRVRDFKGLSPKSFDGRGNYSLGIREQIIFPEIHYDAIQKIQGLTVTITTTAKDNESGRILLSELGMPFRK